MLRLALNHNTYCEMGSSIGRALLLVFRKLPILVSESDVSNPRLKICQCTCVCNWKHQFFLFLERQLKLSQNFWQKVIYLDLCDLDRWEQHCAVGKRICDRPHPAAAWDSLEKWLYMDIQKWGQDLWQPHVWCCLECIQWFPKSYATASKAFRETVFVRKMKWSSCK